MVFDTFGISLARSLHSDWNVLLEVGNLLMIWVGWYWLDKKLENVIAKARGWVELYFVIAMMNYLIVETTYFRTGTFQNKYVSK